MKPNRAISRVAKALRAAHGEGFREADHPRDERGRWAGKDFGKGIMGSPMRQAFDVRAENMASHGTAPTKADAEGLRDKALRKLWERRGEIHGELPASEFKKAIGQFNAGRSWSDKLKPDDVSFVSAEGKRKWFVERDGKTEQLDHAASRDLEKTVGRAFDQWETKTKPYPGAQKAAQFFADYSGPDEGKMSLKVRKMWRRK